ncbi:hypothetical protein [Elizabethkingia meningoseptica]|uniref:hypothetical protein n=1 Tax=Elizabethkingia meningoseptica TaxID=238 RepID=UPI0038914AA5
MNAHIIYRDKVPNGFFGLKIRMFSMRLRRSQICVKVNKSQDTYSGGILPQE